MPSDKPRVTFVAAPRLIKQNEFRSRSEAIIWMIKYVLRENPNVPTKEERDVIYYGD